MLPPIVEWNLIYMMPALSFSRTPLYVGKRSVCTHERDREKGDEREYWRGVPFVRMLLCRVHNSFYNNRMRLEEMTVADKDNRCHEVCDGWHLSFGFCLQAIYTNIKVFHLGI